MTAYAFAAPQASKRHSLEAALERKLIPIIERYQGQIKNESSDLSARELERELWNLESIFIFSLSFDVSLKRKSSKGIRKALEGGAHVEKDKPAMENGDSSAKPMVKRRLLENQTTSKRSKRVVGYRNVTFLIQ